MNMSDIASQDDTWESFFGSSSDLMPSIMGAFDAYLHQKDPEHSDSEPRRTSTPKRSHQVGNFANLSPRVQKILSNVPEQEISKKFSSEETLGLRRHRIGYRSLRGSEKSTGINRSNESLDIISPNVHKMLSNLHESELVISTNNLHVSTTPRTVTKNHSYLFSRASSERSKQYQRRVFSDKRENNPSDNEKSSDQQCDSGSYSVSEGENSFSDNLMKSNISPSDQSDNSERMEKYNGYVAIPLGSYLHSDKGIASRTPVGRKSLGKYLQVPSESSTGVTNSTASSSEVSRPVSLTSLGSCSSSGSSNGALHQPGSAYLASAESLDSDPEPVGSQGSADSGIAEQEHASIHPGQWVLQEVLDTETVYVADLQEVLQGYLEPWRNDPDSPLIEYLSDLFSNLEEIYEFNRIILDDLRAANLDPSKVANVFVQHDSGFKVYNVYCARYPRTMEVLSSLQRDDKVSPLIREKQMLLRHALPLGSYLLKPVQRILKYHLLLQRLSKECESHHKPSVDLALATMTSVASDINNMKRKHEDAVRVQEIQSQLYGWTGADLTTLGELIAEGKFRVQGAKGWRHVFLFEKTLLLAKSKTDGALAYKTHIECSNLMLVEQVRGEPLSFQVLPFDNPRLQCTLRARSAHNKREWTLQIKRVILENYSAVIPNHARQLVMQLGQDVHESDDTSEKWSPLKHSSTTPHYLERRTRVRKTRELSKERSASQDRPFTSFGSWRRRSEPSMIPQQYDAKVVPKRISKLKKSKEYGSSTFYMNLSDSENCDIAAASVESLTARTEDDKEEEIVEAEINPTTIENNLEKIVSDLLMQNREFHKVFNRGPHQNQRHPRRNVTSEPGPIWYDERPQLPSKADSLPRSFQLNDPTLQGVEEKEDELKKPHRESDISSRLDDTNHPEYKIYRKTPIRLSMLQRIRMILSEEQRRNYNKHPFHNNKQGNKSTGEKLAHPDYVDPQTLFINSRNNSEANLNQHSELGAERFASPEDIMGERVQLDMSLNSKEVLKEIEKRLNGENHEFVNGNNTQVTNKKGISSRNSPSDSYYESILDSSLAEEYVRDKTGKLVAKSDSFTNNDRMYVSQTAENGSGPSNTTRKRDFSTRPVIVKRPTKSPPPIPLKPLRLSKHGTNQIHHPPTNSLSLKVPDRKTEESKQSGADGQTSWVKAMVGRFE